MTLRTLPSGIKYFVKYQQKVGITRQIIMELGKNNDDLKYLCLWRNRRSVTGAQSRAAEEVSVVFQVNVTSHVE